MRRPNQVRPQPVKHSDCGTRNPTREELGLRGARGAGGLRVLAVFMVWGFVRFKVQGFRVVSETLTPKPLKPKKPEAHKPPNP